MASSEISSSDIFQGQGFYNDGGNEAAGIPPLPAPVAPSQVPLDTDEGMWKKYSSHYEFPLSLLIALGIHLVAVLLVIAFMAIKIHWGQPKPTIEEQVILEGPRFNDPDANGRKPQEGGGNGSRGDNSTDPFTAPFDPVKLEKPSTTPVDPEETGTIIPPNSPELNKTHLLKSSGKPKHGKVDGPGSGSGFGPGEGVGVEMGRNVRWNIMLSYDDPETLLSQLANLQCTIAGRANSGRYLVFKQLASQPSQYDEMTGDAFASWVNSSRQLWFINNDRNTSENFVYAVNRSERLLSLVMIIPHDMEKAILAAELKHHRMTEDQVRAKKLRTSFRVVRQGGGYQVEVVKSEVLKQ